MIQHASDFKVSEILNPDNNNKYSVPKYQREYIWGKNERETLFDDIYDRDDNHFIGSILCIIKKSNELEIVDGQQRLITLSLLFCAIYEKLSEMDISHEDQELFYEMTHLKYRIICKDTKFNKIDPSLQNNNKSDYLSVLNKVGLLEDEIEQPKNAGNRRIFQTYYYFKERLNDFDINNLIIINEKLKNCILVKIEVNSHSDAFTLFETLNNRGVPLSALDIIKNKMLSELHEKETGDIDSNFKKWQSLLKNLTDDYSIQERFLRHYFNAFKEFEPVKINSIKRATKSNLIEIYEKLIDRDPSRIFKDLREKAGIYNKLIDASNEENSDKIRNKILDLERIGGVTSYSFLLYYLSKFEYDEDLFFKLLNILTTYFVRRNLTDIPPTRDLDTIFIELIKNNRDEIHINRIIDLLTDESRFASDEIFKKKLKGNIYEENSRVTRFILTKIEENKSSTRESTDLWKRDDKNKFVWTIEHIFPQGKNITLEWVDMIADGNQESAEELQEEHVHKLGNLTITGYNSKLSNLPFNKKRDRLDSKGNSVGYKNGLFLNNNLKDKEKWTIKDIKSRTEILSEISLELFQINNENI